MSYFSGTQSASSVSPPVPGAFGSSPPPGGALGPGSSRQRRIVWCPGPRLFGRDGDDDNANEDVHDDLDASEDERDGDSDASGETPRRVRKAASRVLGRTKKSAGFFIVGLPELKLYEYLGNVGLLALN
jgi:hypothetical protein